MLGRCYLVTGEGQKVNCSLKDEQTLVQGGHSVSISGRGLEAENPPDKGEED